MRKIKMANVKHSIAAARAVRTLLRQLQQENWELESARVLAYEELRLLRIPSSAIDVILRRVAQARTESELLESLETFAILLAPGQAFTQALISRLGFLSRPFRNRHKTR